MNIKTISIISILVIGIALFGCNTPKPSDNLPAGDSSDLLNEIDSAWIDDTSGLSNEEMIANDTEMTVAEVTTNWIDANETIDVGEMI